MIITKKQELPDNFKHHCYYFHNARSGLLSVLESLQFNSNEKLLIPSYIGWSSREGSGIFDPVEQSKVEFDFYKIKKDLTIDFESLKNLVDDNVKVCLLVNYFGFPDDNYLNICKFLKSKNILIIEDQAHSLFSYFVGKSCGIYANYSIFSLHKMLPFVDGGLVISHDRDENYKDYNLKNNYSNRYMKDLFEFDLTRIAIKRCDNFATLLEMLRNNLSGIAILKKGLSKGIIPQTFPVILDNKKRDELYFKLNENGFGAVSLYHTLISEIDEARYPDAHHLSRSILNLPIHQDTNHNNLREMVEMIKNILNDN